MNRALRVMVVDDAEDDATLLVDALRRDGYDVGFERLETAAAMRAALQRQEWDVITSDHSMPQFSAPAALALALALATELRPNVPFIIVSAEIDLCLAVSLMKAGARDYVQKNELPRLAPAIARALRDAAMESARQQTRDELNRSEQRYRRLFETAQDGILILDANTGQIIDVNPFLIDLLDYAREEFLGKQLWEIGAFHDVAESRINFRELQAKGYVRYEDLPLRTRAGGLSRSSLSATLTTSKAQKSPNATSATLPSASAASWRSVGSRATLRKRCWNAPPNLRTLTASRMPLLRRYHMTYVRPCVASLASPIFCGKTTRNRRAPRACDSSRIFALPPGAWPRLSTPSSGWRTIRVATSNANR